MRLYTIPEEQEAYTHIPKPPGIGLGYPLTVCGWTDVAYFEVSGDWPTCPTCRKIIAYCVEINESLKSATEKMEPPR